MKTFRVEHDKGYTDYNAETHYWDISNSGCLLVYRTCAWRDALAGAYGCDRWFRVSNVVG